MTTLARFDPWREALSLRDAMDRLFEQSFVNPLSLFNTTVPGIMVPMDVYETKNGYEVKVLLPGINPDHLELTVQGETLTITVPFSEVSKPRRISITGGQTVESGSQKQLAGAH